MKLFADKQFDAVSSKILKAMENIDDECDQQNIIFVKTNDEQRAKSLGISQLPGWVYYQIRINSWNSFQLWCQYF